MRPNLQGLSNTPPAVLAGAGEKGGSSMAFSRHPRTVVSAAAVAAVIALGGGGAAPHLLAQASPGTAAQQVFDPAGYLPSVDEMTRTLNVSPLNFGSSYSPVV